MWSQGTRMRQRGENRWKRKECPSKKGSVIERSSSALGLVQNLPRILIKLCLRIVCLRDEKKQHISLGWHHLCAEGCSHGAATPHPGERHWCYSTTCVAPEKLRDRKLDSWYKPGMRHCQCRGGGSLPGAVHQRRSWDWRWERWEPVHRRHLSSLENVLLALSQSILSLLSIITIALSRTELGRGLNRKAKCIS